MKILLDTHAFLWAVANDKKLSKKAARAFESGGNELLLSSASAWEIAIKTKLGKLTLPNSPRVWLSDQLAKNRIELLDVSFDHVTHVYEMPLHHRDPFDRLLAAQALLESLPIMSVDETFDAYGVSRVW